MKHTGKKITASSLLMILGVVCFATILVAAALVSYTAVNWTNTVPSGAGSTAKGAANDGTQLPSNPALSVAYTFRLTVDSDIDTSAGAIIITIGKTGIGPTDVVLKFDADNNDVYETTLTAVDSGDVLTFTVGGTLAWTAAGGPYPYDFEITYATAGTYACSGYGQATV